MPIRVLDPDVAARVAAGEVVERPASVVKELVENSLDAGASQVTVELQEGGFQLIRVTDDGCGIPSDELELAFQRHATSKISGYRDLEAVGTLGFRGEALPSIAAVSRVSLASREASADVGREVRLRAGQVVANGPAGCPPGTSVAVEGLFEVLPARRKFLRSPTAEAARVGDLMSRFSLAYPEVRFRLRTGSRETLSSPGTGDLADAVLSVYGAEVRSSMLEASWAGEGPSGGYSVRGYVSAPAMSRANRTYMTFFVNRRWVQSPTLSFALGQAYTGFLPDRRHPIAVVNLAVPPSEVDVNVHPAKREVRFRQEDLVFSAVQRAVRASLTATSPVPEIRMPGPGPDRVPVQPAAPGRFFGGSSKGRSGQPSVGSQMGATAGPIGFDMGPLEKALTPKAALPSLRILGQVRSTYLVTEGPDGLYLMDQHAAHERVLFERVLKEAEDHSSHPQALLEPASVELSPAQAETVGSSLPLLEKYGFFLEPFGDRSYLLRALPVVLGGGNPARALTEVLDLMAYEGLLKDQEEALAASIACHSAVRAGMGLSQQEMEELVSQLQGCDNPSTCPHGRPTMVHLSSHHLEREFGRR